MSEQEQSSPSFIIRKLYIKDLSVEVPGAPQIFLEQEAPQFDMNLDTQSQAVDEGVYETVLTVTVTARVKDKTAYLIEVKQAGIFTIQGLPQEAMEPALLVACPNILFPYAREVISDVVVKAGFPPLLLQPVNFEAMYMQQKQGTQTPQ